MSSRGHAYHHALRRDGIARWRGVLAVLCLLIGYLIINAGLGLAAVLIEAARGRVPIGGAGVVTLTPLTLLAVNLSAAAMIPLAGLLQWAFFSVRPRWLSSVPGGFRWPLLGRSLIIVVPVFAVYVAGYTAVVMVTTGSAPHGNTSIPLLLVVVLTTWAQAAGEEYGFRGLITRSVGSWFAHARTAALVAVPVASVLFAAAHLTLNPWLLVCYLGFGVAASVVSWRTGGLEVAVAMHAANNLLIFGWSALTSGDAITLDRSAHSGGPLLLTALAAVAVTTAMICWRFRPVKASPVEADPAMIRS